MSRKLVAYFSANGVTAKAAKALAAAIDADLYEIRPEIPYTRQDLDWNDKSSRSSVEMGDTSSRPAIVGNNAGIENYDVVFVGFPIWWYVAPTIINTFLESYDFSCKTVIPFATSGGSSMERTNDKLRPSCPGAKLLPGKLLNGRLSEKELVKWVEGLGL